MDNQPQQDPNVKQYFQYAKDVSERDGDHFVLVATITILVSIIALLSATTTPLVLVPVLILIAWTVFAIQLEISSLFSDSYRVKSGKYSYLNELADEIEVNLQVSNIDVYVKHDFDDMSRTIKGVRNNYVVLDAEMLATLTKNEARALLVHEAAHIIFGSAKGISYIKPLSDKIQIFGIGSIIEWMFGFWTRRTEITADRLAVAYTRDPHSLIRVLIKLSVDEKFADYFDEENVIQQELDNHNIFSGLAETGKNSPYLVSRVHEILVFSKQLNIQLSPKVENYLQMLDK